MMRFLKYVGLILLLSGCSTRFTEAYKKLSKPEKSWVLFHPLKAKKAYLISKEVERIKDSIGQTSDIGNDNNGGSLDAFKHSFWMARLTQGIGRRAALSLGKAHEKGNYQTYLMGRKEDGLHPDKPATDMDLHNNLVGVAIGSALENAPVKRIITVVYDSLRSGQLRVLLKDPYGYFLDCDKKRIPLDSLKGKWNTSKCLVPSKLTTP